MPEVAQRTTLHFPGAHALASAVLVAVASASAVTASAMAPPEVTNLHRIDRTLVWDAVPGATAYRAYRGDRASTPDLATPNFDSCRLGTYEVADSSPALLADPPPDSFYRYDVTALDGALEGSSGSGRSLDSWGGCCNELALIETFAAANGSPWPARWSGSNGVDSAEVRDGWARMRPLLSPTYSLGRYSTLAEERDVEATYKLRFDDVATQGIAFGVRTNRGYLQATNPRGQGYGVFVEGFRGDAIGLWKEENGTEIELNVRFDPTLNLRNGVAYRVRFRVMQLNPSSTRLQARIWPDGNAEPTSWQVEFTDSTPSLQGVYGSYLVDSWSTLRTGGPTPLYTSVSDIAVRRLCDPLAGRGAVTTLQETFAFTEGPVWWNGAWSFTDLGTDRIHEFRGAGPATVFRSPAGLANGLARGNDGALLACEHGNRRVSRSTGTSAPTTVVDRFGGLRFNSPNDLAIAGDGTIYFSDPPYGLVRPSDREIAFNGLFRVTSTGQLTVEWQGAAATTGPNGVALAPDHKTLFLADSQQGTILAFDVLGEGRLGAPRTFASGLTTPDGLAVDMAGNLYVATWASTIEVFRDTGERWGSIPLPKQATNCAFGGTDRRRLLVTAHEGIYEVSLEQPGLP